METLKSPASDYESEMRGHKSNKPNNNTKHKKNKKETLIPINDFYSLGSDEPTDHIRAGTYNVFHPKQKGFVIGRLDKNLKEKRINRELNGSALPRGVLETIVSQMERGVATEEAKSLLDSALVAPALGHPKEDDCFTLDEFVRNVVKRKAKETHKTSGNRYTSKVDWASKRVRDQIQDLHFSQKKSLASIARHLGVSRSTLSKANKRHSLYPTKVQDDLRC